MQLYDRKPRYLRLINTDFIQTEIEQLEIERQKPDNLLVALLPEDAVALTNPRA
jgi:hypothetical protein